MLFDFNFCVYIYFNFNLHSKYTFSLFKQTNTISISIVSLQSLWDRYLITTCTNPYTCGNPSPSPLNLFSPSSGPEPPSPIQTISSGQLPLPPLLLLRVVWPCPCVHRCSCYYPSKLLLLFTFRPSEERRTACIRRRSEPGRDDELHFSFRSPENASFSSESPSRRWTVSLLLAGFRWSFGLNLGTNLKLMICILIFLHQF